MSNESTLPVTIDKSHLITIGERLYSSSVELVRELVNNVYDADAEEVKVAIGDNEISVVDNGSGMDLRGLKQYFKIGSPEKMLRGALVSCCLDNFGPEGPEVFTEGTIIYVNRDHPLYRRESRKKETHVLNLTRLIAQELSMMKDGVNPREAYDHQSILLKDAFADE